MSKYKTKNFLHSLSHAIRGILLALKSQRNFVIEILLGIVVIGLAILYKLTNVEIAVLILAIALVLLAELTNTVVEFIVDAYFGNKYSTLAKMSKDIAAGAVFLTSGLVAIIGFIIFLPKLKLLIETII